VVLGQSKFTVTEGAGNVAFTVKREPTPSNASWSSHRQRHAVAGTDYGKRLDDAVLRRERDANGRDPDLPEPAARGDRAFTVLLGSPQGTALGSPSSAR